VDLYLDFNTPLHRLDPRAKVFGLLGAFALLLAFNHPLCTAGVAAVILAMALESRGFSSPGPAHRIPRTQGALAGRPRLGAPSRRGYRLNIVAIGGPRRSSSESLTG